MISEGFYSFNRDRLNKELIFTLPGGSLLLPILAEILDRRKKRRIENTP
ncbi:MAG: hypothetical protein KKH04_14450 [Proteobacteria bacterium]|nr:hypothetical protein [Pseudomonadota bacterium]